MSLLGLCAVDAGCLSGWPHDEDATVAVRRAYRLTIGRREADALDGILAGCPSTEKPSMGLG